MISRFPDGLTGAALLLLRLCCALLAFPALGRLWPSASWWPAAIPAALLALTLLTGFATRSAAAAVGVALTVCLTGARGEAILLLLAGTAAAGALALLGPGAASIDAHRFGRRVIRLEPRSPGRGAAG